MRGLWAAPPRAGHNSPVEMRFIDMFMAALGALVFMAMLLAFLLRYFPRDYQQLPDMPKTASLFQTPQILTRALPPGHANESYEVAISGRGGKEPLYWSIVAGAKELPEGIRFDTAKGILSGTAKKSATARFVLRLTDAEQKSDERPLEMRIVAVAAVSRWIERIVLGLLLAVLSWLLFLMKAARSAFSRKQGHLEQAHRKGYPCVEIKTGEHEVERIFLPGGITTNQERIKHITTQIGVFLIILFLTAAAFIWRLF